MKEIKIFLALLFTAGAAAGITACSDDDKDDWVIADEARGTYKGTYTITSLDNLKDNIEVIIVKTLDEQVTVEFGEITIPGHGVTFSLEKLDNIKLTGRTNDITIPRQNRLSLLDMGEHRDEQSEVVIEGKVMDKTKLTMKVTIDSDLLEDEYGTLELSITAQE